MFIHLIVPDRCRRSHVAAIQATATLAERPDSYGLILARRGQQLAVRAERHRKYGLGVALNGDGSQFMAADRVPYLYRIFPAEPG